MTKKRIAHPSTAAKKTDRPKGVKEHSYQNADGSVTTFWTIEKKAMIRGKQKWFKRTVVNLTDAKDKLAEVKKEIAEMREAAHGNRHRIPPKVTGKTFGDLADYAEERVIVPAWDDGKGNKEGGYYKTDTPLRYLGRTHFKEDEEPKPYNELSWRALIGNKTKLEDISRQMLSDFREDFFRVHKVNKGKPTERTRSKVDVNRRFEVLRHLLNIARVDLEWMTHYPFAVASTGKKLVDGKSEEPRNQLMSREEEKALLKVCVGPRAHMRFIIIGLVDTLLRSTEFYKLTVKDWREHQLKVVKLSAKTKNERQVGVSTRFAREIEEWIETHSLKPRDYLLPLKSIRLTDNRERGQKEKDNDRVLCVKKAFATAKRLAAAMHPELEDLPKLTLKDLRRTGATRMYDKGAPLLFISRMLGHASLEMTKVYIGKKDDDTLKQKEFIDAMHADYAQEDAERDEQMTVN